MTMTMMPFKIVIFGIEISTKNHKSDCFPLGTVVSLRIMMISLLSLFIPPVNSWFEVDRKMVIPKYGRLPKTRANVD